MEISQRRVLQQELLSKFGSSVKVDELLAAHTTYRIGGPALAWITPATPQQLSEILSWCISTHTHFFVMGGGSNVLCDSRGFEGVVLNLHSSYFQQISFDEDTCTAGGGALLRTVVERSLESGFVDLGFLGGIPGTIGGAVAMNAGTRHQWIDSCVERIEAVDLSTGREFDFLQDSITWGYRDSSLRDNFIVTRVVLGPLHQGDVEKARGEMRDALGRRKASQPLGQPNAGSVFRNPDGYSSGALIESCGLKGFSIGGAQVSEKHANFIVNTGNASSDDVRFLIEHIQKEVFKRHGIKLRTEIRFLLEQ